MRKIREIAGYALGGLMFVLLIPTVMWLASGRPDLCAVPVWRMVIAIVLAVLGLSLSVWSIVYMRRKGDGNPWMPSGMSWHPARSTPLPPEPQPYADGQFRLLRRCLRLAVE